ncbi:Secretory lipase (plasmid) [Mycobacterium sp. JS623]|uniref:alpha/beta fold hydrolase n=1 Tax=Mycobacterium sp. JS623 TaxID=212767 RepID=UPI0002A5AB5C|nr:lipase family protein [Mycobacterium sp. JS623]AGB26664.1 Secretory lipase [Mycobacterium sp. JS623]
MAALTFTVSCTPEVKLPTTQDFPPILTEPAPALPLALEQRGEIVSQSELTNLDHRISAFSHAWRATYQSVSAFTGEQTHVSGAFFVPNGPAPDGGWPVIAIAHGTTGTANGCGLSSQPDLRNHGATITDFLKSGHAVAVTDYQGLDDEGKHPFLEPRTAAFNVVDSVRALRALDPSVSPRWIAYGLSQGGQASWASAEEDKQYGDGLVLLGAVALAPAANITGLAELALRHELTKEQLPIVPMVIAGLATYDPTVVLSDYLRGEAMEKLETINGCGPDADKARAAVRAEDVGPTTQAGSDTLTRALQRIELPQRPSDVPLLVINGSKDLTVMPAWTDAAVKRSCDLDVQVEHVVIDDVGHNDLFGAPPVYRTTTDWIADRFSDKPTTPNCS